MRLLHATTIIACISGSTAATAKNRTPDFELIRYRLPAASVAAKLSLTLERCDPSGMSASGEASLVSEAGASVESYPLTTMQLESSRMKRSIAITLHDTGTIATIDSAVEDRTGAIFGNVIKFVAGIAGAFLGIPVAPAAAAGGHGPKPKPDICSAGVLKALQRVKTIETVLAEWRGDAIPSDSAEAIAQSKAIDRLVAERAALRVGVLHVDLETDLDFALLKAGAKGWIASTAFETKPIAAAWLIENATSPRVSANWTVTPPGNGVPAVADQPAAQCIAKLSSMSGLGLCFLTPGKAAFAAEISSSGIEIAKSATQAKASFPIPQWGTLRVLGLSAGFGSNREASMTLDKFGRVSAAKWTSAARAENATAALAGIAEQANTIASANSRLARQKGEIDALETQQTLNRLRACQEILDAGGSACPAEATIEENK